MSAETEIHSVLRRCFWSGFLGVLAGSLVIGVGAYCAAMSWHPPKQAGLWVNPAVCMSYGEWAGQTGHHQADFEELCTKAVSP